MPTYVIFSSDGVRLTSSGSEDWLTVRAGNTHGWSPGGGSGQVRRVDGEGDWHAQEGFTDFDGVTAIDGNDHLLSVAMRVHFSSSNTGNYITRVRRRSTDIPTSHQDGWIPGANLGTIPLLGSGNFAPASTISIPFSLSNFVHTEKLKLVLHDSQLQSSSVPTNVWEGSSWGGYINDPTAGARPRLIVHAASPSTMVSVMDGATQLSDGSTVYLERTAQTFSEESIHLKRITPTGTVTTIDNALGLTPTNPQAMTVVADANDNLFVFYSGDTRLRGYRYLASESWNTRTWFQTNTTLAGGFNSQGVDAVAATFCDQGGGAGALGRVLVVMTSGGGDFGYHLLDVDTLLTSTNLPSVSSGTNPTWLRHDTAQTNFLGGGFSVETDVFGGTRVVAATWQNNATLSSSSFITYRTRVGILTVGGTITNPFSDGLFQVSTTDHIPRRTKVFGVGPEKFVVGIQGPSNVELHYINGTSVEHSVAWTDAGAGGWWDAVHHVDKVWLYFWDGQTLRRRPYFYETNLLGDDVSVNNFGGTATRDVIRTPQKVRFGHFTQIHHNETDGSTYNFIRYQEFFNAPPAAPNLVPVGGFDAIAAQTFAWEFEDPDINDFQDAYELQIQRVSDNVDVVATGKVASTSEQHEVAADTLVNGVEYRWRVRTWDAADEEGPFSSYETFTPTETPVPVIDAPEQDQSIDTSDVMVMWTQVSGEPQDHYRVRVVDENSLAVLVDTGFIESTATEHLVQNLPGDDKLLRFEVTLRASEVEGQPVSVTATVDYEAPDPPELILVPHEFYVEATFVNQSPPSGDRPPAASNELFRRLAGEVDWTRIATGVEAHGTYRDYNAGARVAYEYFARARS